MSYLERVKPIDDELLELSDAVRLPVAERRLLEGVDLERLSKNQRRRLREAAEDLEGVELPRRVPRRLTREQRVKLRDAIRAAARAVRRARERHERETGQLVRPEPPRIF